MTRKRTTVADAPCVNDVDGCEYRFEVGWDDIDERKVCPKCGAAQVVSYEEHYDEAENEETASWEMLTEDAAIKRGIRPRP